MRCVDLNPYSPIGINEDQINFLDTLLIYCFVTESPEIDLEESSRIQRNHEKVVNEGRNEEALIETDEGLIPLKDAANELLLELEKVAEFMDKEVIKDKNVSWLKSISDQKDNLIDLNGTLSGLVMNDLENNDLSFRDLGNKMSNLHQEEMTSKKSNLEKLFIDASKKSIEDTKKIESTEQKDFEDYLKEFLDKIS